MMKPIRASVISVIAIAAALTGCDRNTSENDHSTASVSSASASSTAPNVPNLVTEQTAGKPPLKLKLGEPASFTKGGATLTLTPKTVELTKGPIGNVDEVDKKFDCGQWWTVSLELKIDVQANSTWNSWMLHFNAPMPIAGRVHEFEGHYIGNDDSPNGVITDSPEDIANQLNKAAYDFDADRKQEFHRTLTGVDHAAACKEENGQRVPSDEKPTALDWSLEIGDSKQGFTQLAIWLV
jgi:hypothetical protein